MLRLLGISISFSSSPKNLLSQVLYETSFKRKSTAGPPLWESGMAGQLSRDRGRDNQRSKSSAIYRLKSRCLSGTRSRSPCSGNIGRDCRYLGGTLFFLNFLWIACQYLTMIAVVVTFTLT